MTRFRWISELEWLNAVLENIRERHQTTFASLYASNILNSSFLARHDRATHMAFLVLRIGHLKLA
jgi:hypothetical protein